MATAKPQELSVEIIDHLRTFALSGGSHAYIAQSRQHILDECEKLAKVNAIDASLLKANLFALTGDSEACEYWVRNAEKIGGSYKALPARSWFYALLGEITNAYKYIDLAIERSDSPAGIAIQLAGFGMFRKAQEVIVRSKVDLEPKMKQDIATASRLLQELNLDDEKVCSVMDVSLGFLKEKGLIWLGRLPEMQFLEKSAGGPILSLTYNLSVPFKEASELNAELVDRLVESNFDTLGLIVGLRGSAVNASKSFSLT
jgi:hypothetical protein